MKRLVLACLLLCLAWPALGDMGVQVLIVRNNSEGEDDGMRWMRGDIVLVRGLDQTWGLKEDPDTSDNFVIVTVTDVTVEQARYWLEAHDVDEEHNIIRLRLRRMIWANLPDAVKLQLATTGRYTTTWVAIRQFIRNMRTGEEDL